MISATGHADRSVGWLISSNTFFELTGEASCMQIQVLEVYELPDVPGEGPCGVRKASKGRVKWGGQGGRRPMLVHVRRILSLPIDMISVSATGVC